MSDSLNGAGRPFTRKVEALRSRGLRYADLESGCGRARSTAWFNNLVNGPRWQVSPPDAETFAKFAKLFSTDEADVRRMIAEEWYGIAPSRQSERVKSLEARVDTLTEDDARLVEQLVHRLSEGAAVTRE